MVMEGESVVMVPAVLPWLEYPLVGDGGASSPSDAGWGLSLMMTSHPVRLPASRLVAVDSSR